MTTKKSTRRKRLKNKNTFLKATIPDIKENTIIDDISTAYFPPIVGLDPITNAHEITIEDGEGAYRALKQLYIDLGNGKFSNSFLEQAILFSKNSFDYYATFFRELEKTLSISTLGIEEVKIPFELAPEGVCKTDERRLPVQPPLYLEKVGDKYRVKYKTYGTHTFENTSPIILHRMNYMFKAPDLEEYPNGFPTWYSFVTLSGTLFEKYSPQLNKRIRIDWVDQQFKYFIAGSSDNWQQIYNVPIEMDDVVAILMFRHLG